MFIGAAYHSDMVDKRALKILFDTYWSSAGWKKNRNTLPDDFAYAKASGYMFDPVNLSHDEIIDWLFKVFEQVTLGDVVNGFLASLSTRRLELRSALGSYAVARHFPRHNLTRNHRCEVCGLTNSKPNKEDPNVLNFERYKWGGVRHLDPLYIALDLELFAATEKLLPTVEDIEILKRIIEAARRLNADAKVRDLEKALATIIKSNKEEREILIQILSYCGILQPREQAGFFSSFVNDVDRSLPPVSKIDWDYPVCWWRGKDGVNDESLQYYFPQLNN
jgi:hypothetical protein